MSRLCKQTFQDFIKTEGVLIETVEKAGSQISVEQTEYTNLDTNDTIWITTAENGDIERAQKFKYLGETLRTLILKQRHKEWRERWRQCSDYVKRVTSKFRRYITVVNPVCLNAAETVASEGLSEIELKK